MKALNSNHELSRVDAVKIDKYGQALISTEEAFQALYNNKLSSLEDVYIENNNVIDQYNTACNLNADRIPRLQKLLDEGLSIEEFDNKNQSQWYMPNEYLKFDIETWLSEQCDIDTKMARLQDELLLFRQLNMIDLLRYLKYLVDTMRKHNIVWGVGRGSSVASYALYLIGIHKIDSIKFNLDINEFLRTQGE